MVWQDITNNALKRLISNIIGYATEGNSIIVKTPSIVISVRDINLFMSWIVIYKKKKFHLITEMGETDIVFQSITSFISDTDKEYSDADNS